jgi:hypothetical protein
MSPKSSNFKVLLAATRAYGLPDDHGSGRDQMVKVSNPGLDIVIDYPARAPGS